VGWNDRQFNGQNGTMFMFGGYSVLPDADGENRYQVYNDVWTSTTGETWTQLDNAPWEARHSFATSFYQGSNDTQPALYMAGGCSYLGCFNDVWKLPYDSLEWEQVSRGVGNFGMHDPDEDTHWSGRGGFRMETLGGALMVFGGIQYPVDIYCQEGAPTNDLELCNNPVEAYNDVWRSEDGHVWTQITDSATWSPRRGFGAAVYRNRGGAESIFVFGGMASSAIGDNDGDDNNGEETAAGNDHRETYLTDVYCSRDGVSWKQVCESATPLNWLDFDNFGIRGQNRSSFAVIPLSNSQADGETLLYVYGGSLDDVPDISIGFPSDSCADTIPPGSNSSGGLNVDGVTIMGISVGLLVFVGFVGVIINRRRRRWLKKIRREKKYRSSNMNDDPSSIRVPLMDEHNAAARESDHSANLFKNHNASGDSLDDPYTNGRPRGQSASIPIPDGNERTPIPDTPTKLLVAKGGLDRVKQRDSRGSIRSSQTTHRSSGPTSIIDRLSSFTQTKMNLATAGHSQNSHKDRSSMGSAFGMFRSSQNLDSPNGSDIASERNNSFDSGQHHAHRHPSTTLRKGIFGTLFQDVTDFVTRDSMDSLDSSLSRSDSVTTEDDIREWEDDFLIQPQDLKLGVMIGRGGQGNVYRGTYMGMTVAVKHFPNSASSEASRLQVEKEAYILSRIHHPYVVRLFGVCVDSESIVQGGVSLVMELGLFSLADVLRYKKIPRTGALHIRAKSMAPLSTSAPEEFQHIPATTATVDGNEVTENESAEVESDRNSSAVMQTYSTPPKDREYQKNRPAADVAPGIGLEISKSLKTPHNSVNHNDPSSRHDEEDCTSIIHADFHRDLNDNLGNLDAGGVRPKPSGTGGLAADLSRGVHRRGQSKPNFLPRTTVFADDGGSRGDSTVNNSSVNSVHMSPSLQDLLSDVGTQMSKIRTNHPLTWEQQQSILLQVAEGMMFIHSKRCIHRDIKPGNILIDKVWCAKICDFGAASWEGDGRHAIILSFFPFRIDTYIYMYVCVDSIYLYIYFYTHL
jgi:hypothetical protein